MGKTNTPFSKIYFNITAVNTVDSTITTEVFDYLAKPFRFNTKTATQLKLASLPANVPFYKPENGAIMKILNVGSRDDLDKYFVANPDNPEYASILEMLGNATAKERLNILLVDVEEEVGDGVLPNATNILKAIHEDDSSKLSYQKMARFKEQLHNLGYHVQGFAGLGLGEVVEPTVVSKITPEMLSFSLLDKLSGDAPVKPSSLLDNLSGDAPAKPSELLPQDKSVLLGSSLNISYNIQDDTLFTFELLSAGESVSISDISEDDKTKLDASAIKLKYTKLDTSVVTVTLPATSLVDKGGTSTEIHPSAIKLVDFDKSRIVSISFDDTSVPTIYTLRTLTAPESVEYFEKFKVNSIFEDSKVHIIVTNEKTTLLTSVDEILSVKVVDNETLDNKFGFLFEEKDKVTVPAAVLAYIYVKLAEIKIAGGFGTNENECYTYIEASAISKIEGNIFTYNAPVSTIIYNLLKAQGEGSPITLVRSYDCETKAGNVINLTTEFENLTSLGALGRFFSTSSAGGLDFQNDIMSAKTTYTDTFISKVGLPTLEKNTLEDINLGIPTLAFATPVKIQNGNVVYYWDHPVSLVKTEGIYNTAKEMLIKAYSYNTLNIVVTTAITNLRNRMYTPELVASINEALDEVLSRMTKTFGSQIQMSVTPLDYNESRVNPSIITVNNDGVRETRLNMVDIAEITVVSSLNKFTLSYNRTIVA